MAFWQGSCWWLKSASSNWEMCLCTTASMRDMRLVSYMWLRFCVFRTLTSFLRSYVDVDIPCWALFVSRVSLYPRSCSQVTIQEFIIKYTCLADGSCLLLTNSYILNLPLFLIYPLPRECTFFQHGPSSCFPLHLSQLPRLHPSSLQRPLCLDILPIPSTRLPFSQFFY